MEENTNPTGPPPPPRAQPAGPPPVPPPIFSARPLQPRRRRPVGWIITAIVLFCLLGLSVLLNLVGWTRDLLPGPIAFEQPAGPRLQEAVVESAHTPNKIAVISLGGIIMGDSLDGGSYGMVDLIQAQLKRAAADDRVKAVILKVDSPGGEVLASDEIYQALLRFQTNSGKPVVASMGAVAASGGYYVSAGCQWIVANEMTITGSIGVIMSTFNYRGLMDKIGLQPEVFKSGKFKDMLRGSKRPEEVTPEERKIVQDLINETFGRFKQVVREGRAFAARRNQDETEKGAQLVPNWVDFADGRVFSGKDARRLGFVDEVGNFRTAVKRARILAGLREATLVEFQPVFDLSSFLRFFGKTDVKSIKMDLGVDLPKLKAGQLYFLSPTYLY